MSLLCRNQRQRSRGKLAAARGATSLEAQPASTLLELVLGLFMAALVASLLPTAQQEVGAVCHRPCRTGDTTMALKAQLAHETPQRRAKMRGGVATDLAEEPTSR